MSLYRAPEGVQLLWPTFPTTMDLEVYDLPQLPWSRKVYRVWFASNTSGLT